MKATLCLLVFALMLNCSSDSTYEQVKDSGDITVAAAKVSSKALFGGAVGVIDRVSGKMSLLKDQKSTLAVFNSLLKKSDITAKLTRLELSQVDGRYYLRGYGDTYKSTMLLIKDDVGNLQSAGVTCTTSDCSHTHGCEVTSQGTCSACSGDCKKTTNTEDEDPPA